MRGAAADVTWSIGARLAPDGDLYSMVTRTRGGVTATSGMGGPSLLDDQVVNTWIGQADGLPVFVLVRTAPEVERVTVGLTSGARHEVELSPSVPEFGLRFGAAPIPDNDRSETITIELANCEPLTAPLPQPPAHPRRA